MTAIVTQATEQMRPTIAQLPRPDNELMAGIDSGERLAARQNAVASKDFGKLRAVEQVSGEAKQLGYLATHSDHIGLRQRMRMRMRIQSGIERGRLRSKTVGEDGQVVQMRLRRIHRVRFLARESG